MRRPKSLITIGVPALLALALVVVVGAWLMRGHDDSLERVRDAGVLRIGYAIEAPYAMLDPNGRVTGQAPETARQIAASLGIDHIEWIQLPFDSLIPDLVERHVDVIAAGLFVTPERAREVRFSDPTVRAVTALLVHSGNPKHLRSFASLDPHSDARIAVLAGSVEEASLRKMNWKPENVVTVPDAHAARAALAQNLVDAVALSAPTLRWMAHATKGSYEVLTDPPGRQRSSPYGVAFAFHPEDASLQRAWNRAQARFISTPEHLRTILPFGFEVSDLAVVPRSSGVASR